MFFRYFWDLDDDPDGNVEKLRQHGFAPEDAMFVIDHTRWSDLDASNSSGLPTVIGDTVDGRRVLIVFEYLDVDLIRVVTCYSISES